MKISQSSYRRVLFALMLAVVSIFGTKAASHCYFECPDGWDTPYVWVWDDNGVNCCKNMSWPGDAMKLVDAGRNLYRWDGVEGKEPSMIIIHDYNGNHRMTGENTLDGKEKDGDTPYFDGVVYKGDSSFYTYTGPITEPEPTPAPAGVYCYFVCPDSWNTPHVWAWDEDQANCCANQSWPGDTMTLVDASSGLYIWEAPEGCYPTMIIIHDNGSNRMKGVNSVKTDGDTPFINGVTYHADSTYDGEEVPVVDPASTAGGVTSWSENGTTVEIVCEYATLFITPYSPEVVKVFTLLNGVNGAERRSITVTATPNVDYTVAEEEEAIVISIVGGTEVKVDRSNGLISFYDNEGRLKLAEDKYLRNSATSHSVSFKSMYDVAFFGAGYNGKTGNMIGRTLRLDNTQTGGWGQEAYDYPHCITIPFIASTTGYGVLFDDHWRGATMTPASTGLKYSSGAQNPISYYYVGGENLDKVIVNYTSLTGRQMLPPYWALGYITSRYGYHSEAEAQGYIDDIKNAGLPLDGIVFDLFWEGEDESGMGNLDWYRPQFPDPEKMLKKWHDRGINTILITEPFFTSRCNNYSYLQSHGLLADEDVNHMEWLKSPRVGLLDASNPEALDWMWQFYRDRIKEGITGWWLDLGEPEQHDSDSHHQGGSVSQVHNEFGQLWVERVYNGIREEFPEMRPFLMPRSGTSGMQRLSTFPWTGDILRSWGGLAAQVPALINMAMSGVSYLGSDVGGFTASSTNPQLYLRWVEFATFSPMMRTHSPYKPEPTLPEYSSILPDVKKFINLRYRFLPYTYTLCYLNASEGLPIARPACAFDSDPTILADCKDAYLWGKDIYVAPVLSDASTRQITFPEGEWLDFNDFTKVYAGGSTVGYSAPLDRLPYFMRRGSFIPMFTKSENFGSTSALSYDDLTVVHSINPSVKEVNEGIIYEDDRQSASSLDNEEYAVIRLSSETDGAGGCIINCEPEINAATHFMPETRTLRLHLIGYSRDDNPQLAVYSSQGVQLMAANDLNNQPMVEKATAEEVDAHQGHAFCRLSDNSMYLKAIVPSTAKMSIGLGRELSSVNGIVDDSSVLVFDYVGGNLSYSVPVAFTDASIEFISIDGHIISRVDNLATDGLIHGVATPAINGFCIARLTARSEAETASKVVKIVK